MDDNELRFQLAKEMCLELQNKIDLLESTIRTKDDLLFNAFRQTNHPALKTEPLFSPENRDAVKIAFEQYLHELGKMGGRISYLG